MFLRRRAPFLSATQSDCIKKPRESGLSFYAKRVDRLLKQDWVLPSLRIDGIPSKRRKPAFGEEFRQPFDAHLLKGFVEFDR